MKPCPDLIKMSLKEKKDLFANHKPTKLKALADKLLAESLPHNNAESDREKMVSELEPFAERAESHLEDWSKQLGVTEDLLAAWLVGDVQPPESLLFALRALEER